MLKQSPNRNQRTKGFKAKQGFKIFIFIAIGIWLLYQLKHTHDKKKAYEEGTANHETKILGRKGFDPWIKNPHELIEDTEEIRPERVKEQSSGGDDDIIGHDRVEVEESEEVEDLIDEEDKEKDEENEDEEDMNSLEDQVQGHDVGDKGTQATGEKPYKENGASKVAMRVTQSIGTEFELGELRKIKADVVEDLEKIGVEKQQKKIMDPTEVIFHSTNSS